MQGGDRLVIHTPGGGGFGDPADAEDADGAHSEEEAGGDAGEDGAAMSPAAGGGRKCKGSKGGSGGGGKAAEVEKRKLAKREARPQRLLRDGGSLSTYKSTQEAA